MIKTFLAAALLSLSLIGCGGGGSSAPAPQSATTANSAQPMVLAANQVAMTIGNGNGYTNQPTISITVCVPGTSRCQTIPNILVDSGSSGLRLSAAALGSLALPFQTNPATGDAIAGCSVYAGGVAWGPMTTADIQIGGESAQAVPMQLIDPSYASVPASCSSQGTLLSQPWGLNGILGLASYLRSEVPTFDCGKSGCAPYTQPVDQEIANVVWEFGQDNNGVIISIPPAPQEGANSITGVLTFGIGTESNNGTGDATMFQGITNGLTAVYNGKQMPAFFDTGASVDYISASSLPSCSVNGSTWLCPQSLTSQTATVSGGGASAGISFEIDNAQTVLGNLSGQANAVPNLSANQEVFGQEMLDLGMSSMFGHNLYLQYPLNSGDVPMVGLSSNSAS